MVDAACDGVVCVNAPHPNEPGIALGVERVRVTVLVIYCILVLLNQFQFVGNAFIVDPLSVYLGCSSSDINYLPVAYSAVYIVCAFPACEVFARTGLRITLLAGLASNFLGALLKFIATTWYREFWLMMVGQVISGFAQVLSLSIPPMLAAVWFPVDERAIATSIGTLFAFLGMALGFAIPPAVLDNGRTSDGWFIGLYAAQVGCCFINLVACVVFVPEGPKLPPSVSSPSYLEAVAQQAKAAGREPQVDADAVPPPGSTAGALRRLWAERTNRDFVLTCVCFGMSAGTLNGVSAVLSQLLQPYGIADSTTGIIILVALISGSIACVVAGPFIDAKRIYRRPMLVLYAGLTVLLVVMALLFGMVKPTSSNFTPISFVGIALLVIALLPTLPFGLELAVELTYPLDEAISSTACFWSNAVFSALATVAATLVVGDAATVLDTTCVVGGAAVLILISFSILLVAIEEKRKRFDHEIATRTDASSGGV